MPTVITKPMPGDLTTHDEHAEGLGQPVHEAEQPHQRLHGQHDRDRDHEAAEEELADRAGDAGSGGVHRAALHAAMGSKRTPR